jgi:hypothetical protein
MRVVFDDVPVIYGFSAKAPVGPIAASMLGGYFHAGGGSEITRGHASSKLLASFKSTSMAVSGGLSKSDPLQALRSDYCGLSDDGQTAAQKVAFVHELLDREMAEARPFLDRIERYIGSLSDSERSSFAVARAFDDIARDESARSRFLAFARDADQPTVRARMIKLARKLGWLSPEGERSELVALIRDRLAANVGPADVELACSLNDARTLDSALPEIASTPPATLGQSAMLACLGSAEARERLVPALLSVHDSDFEMAQVYLRHRPLTEAEDLRELTSSIAEAPDPKVQVRALDALASQHVKDPESLEQLARLYPQARTPGVQVAIAGVLLRSDYDAIASPELVQTLRESRLKSHSGPDVVDALIRRLEAQ